MITMLTNMNGIKYFARVNKIYPEKQNFEKVVQ